MELKRMQYNPIRDETETGISLWKMGIHKTMLLISSRWDLKRIVVNKAINISCLRHGAAKK